MVIPMSPSRTVPSKSVQSALNKITDRIKSGVYRIGSKLPAERDLVHELGVSRSVVRLAIAELAQRGVLICAPRCRPVVGAPEPQHYEQPSTSRQMIQAWIWPTIGEYGASTMLRGIQRVLATEPYRLVIASPVLGDWDMTLESERRFLMGASSDREVQGCLLWYLGGFRNLPALQRLVDTGKPVVLLDRMGPVDLACDYVGTDNFGAAKACVQHLIDLGHTRIACLVGEDTASSVRERVGGYWRALQENFLPMDEGLSFRMELQPGERETEAMSELLDRLLDPGTRATAAFAINDTLGMGVVDGLRARGIQVPGDFSVVGFDGLYRWTRGGGELTTAYQNFERIGEVAAERLVARLRPEGLGAPRQILFDAPLVIKSTTTPPA